MTERRSFWSSMPGVLTGIAGVITAVGGLLIILRELEVIGPRDGDRGGGGEPPPIIEQAGQERQQLQERMGEVARELERLWAEIEQVRREAEQNPDLVGALRERETRARELEAERRALEERLSRMPRE